MTSDSRECIHCGLPVARPANGIHDVFCCYGCAVAYSVLGTNTDESEAKLTLYKLVAGSILGINVMMFSMPLYVESLGDFFSQGLGAEKFFEMLKYLLMALSLPVYFLLGMPFIESSFHNVRNGLKTNADSLIAIGVTAALMLSIYNTVVTNGHVYYETAIAILVIVTCGRYLESTTRAKATRTLEELGKSLPNDVRKLLSDGNDCIVSISQLEINDTYIICPGDVIPVDSCVVSGTANVSEAVLTGESHPIQKGIGDLLLGGSINYDGLLTLRVVKTEPNSFAASLARLVNNAKLGKAKIQITVDKVSAIAIPLILIIAICSFIYWWIQSGLSSGLLTFLSVVLVACPCALGIATPAALWVGVNESSKHGILFRSLVALEQLASIRTIFFDKTGTLTKGEPVLKQVEYICNTTNLSEQTILSVIQGIAANSRHPLSQSLAASLPESTYGLNDLTSYKELPSQGIAASIDSYQIWIGKYSFIQSHVPEVLHHLINNSDAVSTWCFAVDMHTNGYSLVRFTFHDEIVLSAKDVIEQLHVLGYQTKILSGDRSAIADALAHKVNSVAVGDLSASDKLTIVHETPFSAFVGDGMNDAGAIAAAQVGIGFSHGSDISITEADVVLFGRELEKIPMVLELSKKTMRIVRQNLVWAFSYNAIGVIFAACGMLNPIIAAIAMVLSSLFVLQNSLRVRTTLS